MYSTLLLPFKIHYACCIVLVQANFLLPKMFELRLTDEDFEKEHYRQAKMRKKAREKAEKAKAKAAAAVASGDSSPTKGLG